MSVRVLVVALVVQLVLGAAFIYAASRGFPLIGGGHHDRGVTLAPRPTVNRFDADRAFAELRAQVRLGPRPAGSPASRRLAERLRRALPGGRFEPVPGGLRNVVGRLPGRRPALLIAAHYDTKDVPGFIGANDGASGTAVVVELARALRRAARRPGGPELQFALFDGEESPAGASDFLRAGVRGARAHLAAHRGELGALVLLDFVGDRDLALPRERGSDAALWSRLRAAARRVGVARAFPDRTTDEIYDDHTPFTRAGVPAIDVIDFTYRWFHTRADTLDKVSPRSLDAVGEAVAELALGLRLPLRSG